MLRLVALAAVALGVVLLAAAAFVLSYEGIHHIALRAGVSPGLAKLYPLIFDVMLVVAAAAALALRGAGWWPRCYAWGSLLILLAAMAVGNAVYAIGATLPAQPTKVAVAVTPWVLLLMAFGLLLELLRHFRTTRSNASMAAPGAAAPAAAAAGTVAAAGVNGGSQTAAAQAAVPAGNVREPPRVDLDTLLGPKAGEPPAIAILHGIGTGPNDGHQVDPVSYGEETGYVHPDSYLDEGEYSPHGDTGGPGRPGGLAGDTTGDSAHLARHDTDPAGALATPGEAAATTAARPAALAANLDSPAPARTTAAEPSAAPTGAPAMSAEPAATSAAVPATAAETPAGPAAASANAAEPLFTPAAAPETPAAPAAAPAPPAETPAGSAAASASAAEPLFSPAAGPATAAETPTTPAEPPTPPAEPEVAAETAGATVAPAGAPVAEAAPGTGNGQAAGGPAGAGTPVGQESMAEAGQGSAGVKREAAGAEAPTLERIRSTPTRPE